MSMIPPTCTKASPGVCVSSPAAPRGRSIATGQPRPKDLGTMQSLLLKLGRSVLAVAGPKR